MARVWGVVLGCCVLSAPARAQSSEHFDVALHARTTRASARAEQAAWLTLTVPLERAVLPRPAAALAPTSAAPEPAAPSAEPTSDPPAAVPAPFSFAQLRVLSALTRQATRVALSVAGAAAERRRLDAMACRSRAAALLPELRLRAQRNTDQALRWAPTSDDPYRVTQADGAGTTLEASATFRLDRLLFSREELSIEKLRAQAGSERLKLERRVVEGVLGLVQARQLGCAAEPESAQRSQQQARVVELLGELDVLTAGWFLEQAPELGRALWGFPEAVLGACQPPETPRPEPATNPVASLADSE